MLIFPTIVAFFLLLIITSYYRDSIFQIASVLAFFAHVFVAVVLLPLTPYGWDIGNFHTVAVGIPQGEFISASTTVQSFGTIQGFLYIFFPSQPETMAIFNGLFAVVIVIPAVYLCRQLYPTLVDQQYGVMGLILFLPLPFYILSLPMRDALSVLLFFALLALGVQLIRTKKLLLLSVGILLWNLQYLIRPELALVLLLGFVAAIMFTLAKNIDLDFSISKISIMLATIGALGIALFAEFLYNLDRANAELTWRAQGGAVYLEGMEYASWFDFILVAPIRALYFQFAPFPVHIEQVFHLLGFTMTPIIIILFVSAIRSLYHCDRNDTVAVFLVVVYLAGITGYGVINSNFGTNVRHRIVFDFMLVVFAAPVLKKWELQIRRWLSVTPEHSDETNTENNKAEQLESRV